MPGVFRVCCLEKVAAAESESTAAAEDEGEEPGQPHLISLYKIYVSETRELTCKIQKNIFRL